MSLHLSRIRLRHAPDTAALARVLVPEEENARIAAAHRLVWSLFADHADRRRDFLWRADGGSTWQRTTFLVLSARPPVDRHGLFEVETKPFEPELMTGARLGFRLRASLGAADPTPHGQRGKRVDPLARALRGLDKEARAGEREAVTQRIGAEWLARQGAAAGFRLAETTADDGAPRPLVRAEGDAWHVLPREGARPVRFSTLDLEGELTVDDPGLFLDRLGRNLTRAHEADPPPHGFGRAKAFGCGLMLIRRAG